MSGHPTSLPSTASVLAFPANLTAWLASVVDAAMSAGSSQKSCALCGSSNRPTSSSRTCRAFSPATGARRSKKRCASWTKVGTMRSGSLSALTTSMDPIDGSVCASSRGREWSTPSASAPNEYESPETWLKRKTFHASKKVGATRAGMPLSIQVKIEEGVGAERMLNPEWVECLMAFPPGWSEPEPSFAPKRRGPRVQANPSTSGSPREPSQDHV